jgi:hypothetical protein
MKAGLCVLTLAALSLFAAARPAAAQSCIDKCAEHVTAVSSAVNGAHARAISLAPQGQPGRKVYGEPIQKPILRSRPKPKPHLVSSPLP